ILYVSSIEPHLAEVSNLNFPEFKRAGQNNAASDAIRLPLDSESCPFSLRQTLSQIADAGRINFENQGVVVFDDSSLDPDRLPHMLEKRRLGKRLPARVHQLKHGGLTAEVIRGKQNRNASAETTRSAVAVYFAAARVHNTEVAFAVHDFPVQLKNSKHLFGCRTRFRRSGHRHRALGHFDHRLAASIT